MTKKEIAETYRRAWMSYFHPGMDEEKDAKNLQDYEAMEQWVFENSPIQRVELRKDSKKCFLRLVLENEIEVEWQPDKEFGENGKFAMHSDGIGGCIVDKWTAEEWEIISIRAELGFREFEVTFDMPIDGVGCMDSRLIASRTKEGVIIDADFWRGFSPGCDGVLWNKLWEYLLPFSEESGILGDRAVSADIEQAAKAAGGKVADND